MYFDNNNMTTYINVFGNKDGETFYAGGTRIHDQYSGDLSDIALTSQQISWSVSDTLSMTYPTPYDDLEQFKDYYIHFTTPNDGISHTYNFSATFNLPAGYLTAGYTEVIVHSLWQLWTGGTEPFTGNPPWTVYDNLITGHNPFTFTTTPDSLSGSPSFTLPPNTPCVVTLWILYYMLLNHNDTCPFSGTFSVTCPDFSGGSPAGAGNLEMICEMN
jgi:hypothetical protein